MSVIFVLAAVFVLVHPVKAQIAKTLVTGLRDIVQILVGNIVLIYVQFLGFLLLMVIQILIAVAQYNDFVNSAVVTQGWAIVRDISNMFFILILLYIAFATILGISGVDWKQRLPKLLIFAVLINFTRVIAGIAIDFGQVIMITFVNGFKDAAGGNFADLLGIRNLMQLSASGTLIAPGTLKTSSTDLAVTLGGLIGAALFATIAFIVIILITIVLIYRMVMLWIQITLSPLAFILGAFPQGESYYAQWWKQFVSTIAIGPLLAFFLWLSLLTVSQITQGINTSVVTIEGGERKLDVVCGPNEICQTDSVLAFLVGVGLLIGGLTIAQSIAGSAGEGMGGLVGWAKKAGTGAIKRFTGVSTVQKARDAFQKKDMQAGGIGGALAKAGVYMQAGLVGGKAQKAVKEYQSSRIKEQRERMATLRDQELIERSRAGSSYERAAALAILSERGAINEKNGFTRDDVAKMAKAQFGNDTAGYAQFMQGVKKSSPGLAYDLKNPAEREQFITDARRGIARVDNLESSYFEGAEGQEFVRGLTEGQTVEQIKAFYNKLTDDAADAFETQIKALIAAEQSTPEMRQALADMTNDIDTAFPATLPTANAEIQRWVRRTSTSMLQNRQAAIARAQKRIGGAPPSGGAPPAGGAPPPPGGAPPPPPPPPPPTPGGPGGAPPPPPPPTPAGPAPAPGGAPPAGVPALPEDELVESARRDFRAQQKAKRIARREEEEYQGYKAEYQRDTARSRMDESISRTEAITTTDPVVADEIRQRVESLRRMRQRFELELQRDGKELQKSVLRGEEEKRRLQAEIDELERRINELKPKMS